MERKEIKVAEKFIRKDFLFFKEDLSQPVYSVNKSQQDESFILCELFSRETGIDPWPWYRFTGNQVQKLIELKRIYFMRGDG